MSFWDDNSNPTVTVDFNWSHVDAECFSVCEADDTAIEQACECQRRIWKWVYQPSPEGQPELDGFLCRAAIACWVFLPQIRDMSMVVIAGKFGKKKQSLGRWVADFKKEFPDVAKHLQHLKT